MTQDFHCKSRFAGLKFVSHFPGARNHRQSSGVRGHGSLFQQTSTRIVEVWIGLDFF